MSHGVALLVINRNSRRGEEAAEEAIAALQAAGVSIMEEACTESQALADLIVAWAASVDCVIVGGGDGTLNAALPGLLKTGLPLGIIPLGTANDLARTLGILPNATVAARIIAAGRTRRIDIGEANGHPFFNVASMGFGVDVTRALTRDAKRRWGVFGYVVAAIRALRRMARFTAIIEQGGEIQRSRTVHLAIGNGRYYGGGMSISDTATIDDGRLDVYSLEVRRFWRLLWLLPALRRGDLGKWEEVRTLSGSDITVRTRRPRSVNADGEMATKTPCRFRVRPGAVTVFAP